jgi:hypothetical protein
MLRTIFVLTKQCPSESAGDAFDPAHAVVVAIGFKLLQSVANPPKTTGDEGIAYIFPPGFAATRS